MMRKKNRGEKRVALKWVKPEVKVEKLSTRSLLGENGWFGGMNRLAVVIGPTRY